MAVVHQLAPPAPIAADLVGNGVDELVEHRQDRPSFVANDDGHLAIEVLALVLVKFGARPGEKLVELLVGEARFIPRRSGQIGGRVLLSLYRAPGPEGGAEGLLVPDLLRVAVVRLGGPKKEGPL